MSGPFRQRVPAGLLWLAPVIVLNFGYLLSCGSALGGEPDAAHPAARWACPLPGPLAHTYSIVARDSTTGQLGVAVQSHWFSVGPTVPWAEAGVGAVATQSLVEVSYGPLALDMLRAGKSAQEALEGLLAADAGAALRQVAIVDNQGRVAVHTGERCIPEAGHQVGPGFSVQANLMLQDTVWPAMAQAFTAAQGDLAERLLQALDAAQAAGGDIRGRQSAAILIVAPTSSGQPWLDRELDLRVEDSPQPLVELRRLVAVHRAYQHMNEGDEALGRGDIQQALKAYAEAGRLQPENLEIRYWQAVTMSGSGYLEEALPIFRDVFAADPNWRTLTPRLHSVGLLDVSQEQLDQILSREDSGAPARQKR